MKNDDNLIITKDNYKGYVELCKLKENLLIMSEDKNNKMVKSMTAKIEILASVILVFGISILISVPIIIGVVIGVIGVLDLVSMVCDIWMIILGQKKQENYEKEKYKFIQEEYPYVDTKIDIYTLKAVLLKKTKLIQYGMRDNGDIYTIYRVNAYEDYLKAEEIKEKYFLETKYKRYVVNPKMREEELEKVKVKSLVR